MLHVLLRLHALTAKRKAVTGNAARRVRAPTPGPADVSPRLAQLGEVIRRAVERGDVRADTDARLTHELLVGPVFYRLLFSGQPLDDGLAARVNDAVLRAFAAQ